MILADISLDTISEYENYVVVEGAEEVKSSKLVASVRLRKER